MVVFELGFAEPLEDLEVDCTRIFIAIKPQLEEAVAIKYPTTTTKKLNELRFGDNVIVMGTVIKVYKNQPSILKTIAAGDVDMNEGMKQEDKAGKKYCDDDEIFLEDETQE